VEPDEEALGTVLEETVPARIRDDMFTLFDRMGASHPRDPHWYLPLIGVNGPFQGRGYGSALLRHALAICDSQGMAAYLESSNPKNVPLYRRHGFELTGTIQAGSSPEIYPMLRRPGSGR
jgi:ribosomal protein S18 acetylase RimI-like enzyme